MKLLDLFCGAGGASVGYYRAGFEVVGVDIKPQPYYPFPFIQADVTDLHVNLDEYDLIHASPPCQAYSMATPDPDKHPALIAPVRELLAGRNYVIENVPGAKRHMNDPFFLCGSMFGLSTYDPDKGEEIFLKRHRLFEASFPVDPPPDTCKEFRGRTAGVYGHGREDRGKRPSKTRRGGYTPRVDVGRKLMGITWCDRNSLKEAIPPAYTQFIGETYRTTGA